MKLQHGYLVIQAPNWLGDVIMAQPAMRAFTLALQPERVVISGPPWLADILPFLDLPGAGYDPAPHRADVCILFRNSFRSAWQAMRSGAKRRIGYRGQWRRLLLTDALVPRFDMKCDHHRGYFNDLAIQSRIPLMQEEVRLKPPASALAAGKQWLEKNGFDAKRVLCIAPGAQFGGAKRYPAEQWAEVIALLSAKGFQIVALGTPAERKIAEQSLARCSSKFSNTAGETSLRECLQLLGACRGLLCNDSGLMHVAAGMGKPVVSVFGATDPERTAPSGSHVRLIYQPANCSPCLQRECTVSGQPCMRNIPPAEVAHAFVALNPVDKMH